MGCCSSRKSDSPNRDPQQISAETNICLQSLEEFLNFLLKNPLNHSPYIEAMILYFSKIHESIFKDVQEPLKHQNSQEFNKTFESIKILRQNVQAFAKEIEDLFNKYQGENEEDKKTKIEEELEGMNLKINQFNFYLKELSGKGMNFLFASYGADAKGLASYDFVIGYDKLLTRLKKIQADLGENAQEFDSLIAAEFWVKNFQEKNEADYDEFFSKLQLFAEQINKINISSNDYSKIQFDVGGNKSIEKKAWDQFFRTKWCLWNERKKILN